MAGILKNSLAVCIYGYPITITARILKCQTFAGSRTLVLYISCIQHRSTSSGQRYHFVQ